MDIPADSTLDVTLHSNWTMSAWVKPTSYGGGIKWPVAYGYGARATMGLTVKEAKDPNPPLLGSIEMDFKALLPISIVFSFYSSCRQTIVSSFFLGIFQEI